MPNYNERKSHPRFFPGDEQFSAYNKYNELLDFYNLGKQTFINQGLQLGQDIVRVKPYSWANFITINNTNTRFSQLQDDGSGTTLPILSTGGRLLYFGTLTMSGTLQATAAGNMNAGWQLFPFSGVSAGTWGTSGHSLVFLNGPITTATYFYSQVQQPILFNYIQTSAFGTSPILNISWEFSGVQISF